MDTDLLQGRVALVTGGSRGIGAATARAMGRHGAAVAVNYHRSRDAADAVVADVEAAGSRGLAVGADVTDDAAVAAMVEEVSRTLGDVDVLVVNAVGDTAGIFGRNRGRSLLDGADGARALAANQLATVFATCRHVVPGMRRRGGGSIVLVGSSGARQTTGRAPADIAAAKAAQYALAKGLAAELGPDGIRVNVVAPGLVPTDANAGPYQAETVERLAAAAPMGCVPEAEDVADTIVAFASGLTRRTTGAFVAVDAGLTMV